MVVLGVAIEDSGGCANESLPLLDRQLRVQDVLVSQHLLEEVGGVEQTLALCAAMSEGNVACGDRCCSCRSW